MKLSTSSVFASIVLASVVYATPLPTFGSGSFSPFTPHRGNGNGNGNGNHNKGHGSSNNGAGCDPHGKQGSNNGTIGISGSGNNGSSSSNSSSAASSGTAVGAAYFITNEATGNFVVAADIAQDGTLTLANAVPAGGAGAHGLPNLNGPDPLFSQGAVKVSAAAQLLATVNPGSNTVSLFSIDPANPSDLKMVGFPTSTEGEFPMSLAFNKDGTQLCVLNGGTVNGVNCYAVDKTNGLTSIPNTLRSLGLNQTTPANGPAGTTSHILFSEDNTKLFASVKGIPPTPGFVATFDVAQDGTLSPTPVMSTPATGGLLPFSMTVIPGKNAILATDAGVGFDIFDFSKGDSASSTVIPIDGQMATCWSSFSKKTGNFYLTDIGTAIVTEVNVDDNLKGSIVQQLPQGNGTATIDNDVATIGGNDFLYVMQANATTINVISLDAPGKTTPVQSFNFGQGMQAAGITINPFNVQGMTTFISAN